MGVESLQLWKKIFIHKRKEYKYCSLRRVQLHAYVQAHTQVSLCVQFMARATS